jgi:hypothetical protein
MAHSWFGALRQVSRVAALTLSIAPLLIRASVPGHRSPSRDDHVKVMIDGEVMAYARA